VEQVVGASTTSQAGEKPSAAGNSVKRTPNLVEFVDISLTLPFLSASQHQHHCQNMKHAKHDEHAARLCVKAVFGGCVLGEPVQRQANFAVFEELHAHHEAAAVCLHEP
jgi:hypothetical protein